MTKVFFTKMSGAGNDFIMLDNRSEQIQLSEAHIAKWCKRGTGIGADGLILLEKSGSYDFAMRYYNADGRLGSMCGNGGRCAVRFAFLSGITKTRFSFEANGARYDAEILDDGRVKLKMQPPKDFRDEFQVEGFKSFYIDTGSPHAVVYVNGLNDFDVFHVGRAIRHNATHFPAGANVNFIEPMSSDTLRIRTFERGVEAETLACGTGCVAAALVGYKTGRIRSTHVKLVVQSGDTIDVEFDDAMQDVFLIGSADVVFRGEIDL
jgi:diaminopimelate epimerase